jgi:hypothetical protein
MHSVLLNIVLILFDKRRELCYASIPKAQRIDVSSAVSARVGPYVLLGQLRRVSRIITDRVDVIQAAAFCVRQLRERGCLLTKLLQVVQRLGRSWYLYAGSRSVAWYSVIKLVCTDNGI